MLYNSKEKLYLIFCNADFLRAIPFSNVIWGGGPEKNLYWGGRGYYIIRNVGGGVAQGVSKCNIEFKMCR